MRYQTLVPFVLAAGFARALPANGAAESVSKRATPELSLTAKLRLADTAIDRYELLPKNEDFIFDFTKNETPLATSQNFPALVGSGAALSYTQLPACGMSVMHLHPRANELFVVTSGHIHSEMVPEGGVTDSKKRQRVISNELYPGIMTIYPAGSFHTQVNPDCEAANGTAYFTAEDLGFSPVASQTFAFGDDVVAATFGQSIAGEDVEKVRDAIPEGALLQVEKCLKKCGKEKRRV